MTNLQVSLIQPFGARVTGVDITEAQHVAALRELTVKYGVVLLPSGSHAPHAPSFASIESISTLAHSFGATPDYPLKDYMPAIGVQKISMRGENGKVPDNYLYHVDTSWIVQPCLIGLLANAVCPSTGGDTLFIKSSTMYNNLSTDMKTRLENLTACHTYRQYYHKINREVPYEIIGNDEGFHPAILRHPDTDEPILYISQHPTSHFAELSTAESNELLQELFNQMYPEDMEVFRHKWTSGDLVLWDDIAMQHLALDDYVGARVMYRSQAGDMHYRTERFFSGDRGGADGVRKRFNRFFEGHENVWRKDAYMYEMDMRDAGFTLIEKMADKVIACAREFAGDGPASVLDARGRTGMLALGLLQKHDMSDVMYADTIERCKFEAERRRLYKEYFEVDVRRTGAAEKVGRRFAVTAAMATDRISCAKHVKEWVDALEPFTEKGGCVVVGGVLSTEVTQERATFEGALKDAIVLKRGRHVVSLETFDAATEMPDVTGVCVAVRMNTMKRNVRSLKSSIHRTNV